MKISNIFISLALITLISVEIGISLCLAASIDVNGQTPSSQQVLELTLEDTINLALENNRSIINQQLTVEQRRLMLRAAYDVFDVKISPLSNINYTSGSESEVTVWEVGGRISRDFKTGIQVELLPSIAKSEEDYDASIGFAIELPLLRGRGEEVVKENIYANEFGLATSLRSIHRQRENILLETVSSVYSFVREEQLIKLYQEQIKKLSNHLRQLRIKEKIGLAPSMDVYRVEIRIKEVEDSLNLSQERVENISDQLKSILALSLRTPIRLKAPLLYSTIDISEKQAVEVALNKRIEIKQGRAGVIEAGRRSRVAKHNILPELNLQATYTRRGRSEEFDRLFIFDEDIFKIGLVSTTDFARSSEKTKWQQSKLLVKKERLQLEDIQEDIISDVRRVLNSLEKSKQRIELRREQINQADGKQRLAYVKFQHGKANNFDLVESQVQLQRAQANLVSDEIEYIVGGYRLRAAMGTLLEYKGM